MSIRLSINANLFLNTSIDADPYANPVWDEIKIVRDLTITATMGEADATSRLAREKKSEPTLHDLGFEFEILADPDNAEYQFLVTKAKNRTAIDIWISDGAVLDVGANYIRADVKVTGFTLGQALDGVQIHTVKMLPAYSTNAVTASVVT